MAKPVDPRLLRAEPALRRFLAVVTLLQTAGAALLVLQVGWLADVIARVFDRHVVDGRVSTSLVLVAMAGGVRALLGATGEYLAARTSLRVRAGLREAGLRAVLALGPEWARRQPAGRIVAATGPSLDAMDGYLTRALPALVTATVVPVVVLARISLADLQSGVLLLVMLPLVPLFMVLVGITTRRRVERQYVLLARMAGHFLDLVRGLSTLAVYGQARRQERTVADASEKYRRHTMSALRVAFLSALVLDLVAALSVAVIAVDVGLRLDAGHVAFGTALLVLFLAPEVFAPLRRFGALYHANAEGAVAAEGLFGILDEAADVPPRSVTASPVADGRIELDDVTVRYADRPDPALRGVSLAIEAGAVVAIVGRSGAGKSTLLAAVRGAVDPVHGRVLAGGVDVAGLPVAEWAGSLAWVPQRPLPSQSTVADEVRLGNPLATEEEVAEACRTCRAPAPGTELGEDGERLSAGQRRRVALARALVRATAVRRSGACPVLVLDEPSEDLDPATEAVVAQVVRRLAGTCTVLIATHSPVLAAVADRRVTLDAGRVVADEMLPPAPEPPDVAPADVAPADVARPAAQPDLADDSEPARMSLWRLVRAEQGVRAVASAAALASLAGVAGLALTGCSTWLISRAAEHPNVQALAVAVVGVRTFAIARALSRYAERLASHDAALRLSARLRVRVFAGLRERSAALNGQRGDQLRRFVADVDGVQDAVVRGLVPTVAAGATALAATVLAMLLVPAAGVVLGCAAVLAGGVLPWAARTAAGRVDAAADAAGQREAATTRLVDAFPELDAYGASGRAVDAIRTLDTGLAQQLRRAHLTSAVGVATAGIIEAATLAAVLLVGARALVSGALAGPGLAVLAACVLIAFEAISPLPSATAALAQARAGLDRVADVLSRPALAEGSATAPSGCLSLRARELVVAPAPGRAPVLAGAVLDVPAGSRVAVVGPSGCGKTTLLRAAVWQLPHDGELALHDASTSTDVSQTAQRHLAIAGSLQDDHVFDATLRDNLRVVRPQATDAELEDVAARAGLADFVRSLPRGWDTPAGADGAVLSGGQRQRLLLARALLADPRILVLDEPTAHLDAETEAAVLADLFAATRGTTVLLSTHRTAVARGCDAVLLMRDGQLRELSGTARQVR